MARDIFYLGGVRVYSQDFAEITHELGSVFQISQFDGIVGFFSLILRKNIFIYFDY